MKLSLVLTLLLISNISFADNVDKYIINYESVSEALESLSNDKQAEIRKERNWAIVNTKGTDEMSIYSFTPSGHPAHPAVVKRTVYEENGTVNIALHALCEAEKNECDKLVNQFQEMVNNMKSRLK